MRTHEQFMAEVREILARYAGEDFDANQQRGNIMNYKKTGMGNEILDCGSFAISFNPNPGGGTRFFAGDTNDGETAIISGGRYFILNGDFREVYSELSALGLDACLEFFASKPELVSSWSNSLDELNETTRDAE